MAAARTTKMSSTETIFRDNVRIATMTISAPSLVRARDIAVPAIRKGQNIFKTPVRLGWLVIQWFVRRVALRVIREYWRYYDAKTEIRRERKRPLNQLDKGRFDRENPFGKRSVPPF